MDHEITGKFIKKLRGEMHMSQDALAEKVHVTRQAVSNWEVGKALPDSRSLMLLSEIFDVTINELLNGERYIEEEPSENDIANDRIEMFSQALLAEYSEEFDKDYKKLNKKVVKRVIEEKDNLEKITLELVDKYNSKSRRLKKVTVIFTSIITTLLLAFLLYYFIISYNTIQVFMISGEGDNFFTQKGVMINTKKRTYMRLGRIKNLEEEEYKIENVKLYYRDNNNKEKVLYNDEQSDILITEMYGYNEFYQYKDLEYVKNNLYIEITYNGGNVETIKLKVTKDFANDVLYYEKYKETLDSDWESSYDNLIKEAIKAIRNKGKIIDDSITFIAKEENKIIEFYYQEEKIIINVKQENEYEMWTNMYNQNTLIYFKSIDSKKTDYERFNYDNFSKLTKKEKEIYDTMEYYIDKYLLS